MNSRTAHIATDNLSSIRVTLQNFYIHTLVDSGLGSSAAVTACIEYSGTFYRIQFGGANNGTIPDASILTSDWLTVSIPQGATFYLRVFWSNPNGVLYNTWQISGEAVQLSATTISDLSGGGAITNSGAFSHPAFCISAITTKASVIVVGDSLGIGVDDDLGQLASQNLGIINRAFNALGVTYINLSAGGQTSASWNTGATARNLIIQKGSHLVCELGVNDIFSSGLTSAQLITNLNTIYALARSGQKIFQTTITPNPSDASGSPYTTLVNQTVKPSDANRVTFNTAVRATLAGTTGAYDVASVLESSLNSGKWIVNTNPTYPSAPPWTPDGLHPNTPGYQLVAASGVIPTPVWP